MGTTFNVVFLSPNNPARAHIAEALLNHVGKGRFRAYGLCDRADENIDPHVLRLLESKAIATSGIGCKRWADFKTEESPQIDFACMLFDPLAGESAPDWHGEQLTAEWHISDPMAGPAVSEIEIHRKVAATFHQLDRRIALLVNLPFEKLDALAIQKHFEAHHDLTGQQT